jgi:hypothetical protein
MSRLARVSAAASAAVVVLQVCLAVPAYAGGGLQKCLDKAIDHNGEPPTCTKVNGQWVASWPDSSPGGDMFGTFVFFAFVALLVGGAVTLWRVRTARAMAERSGMDPGLATRMTLLSDDGLDATYLASSLRSPVGAQAPSTTATPSHTTAARLEELKSLLDRGLVTQVEYDERRQAIINSL